MRIRIMMFAVMVMLAALPALAQEDEMLEFVTAAFENFVSVETYEFEVTQSVDQSIEADMGASAFSLEQTLNQNATGVTNVAAGEADMHLDQEIFVNTGGQAVEATMSLDMIVVDETIYLRVDDVSANLASMFPEGWINFTEDAASIPGGELLSPESLTQLVSTAMLYPINEDTVVSIEELEPESLDGEAMRVFLMTMDTEAVFEQGGDAIAGTLNGEALGVDVDALVAVMTEGMTIELTAWISEADTLVHRMDGVVTISTTLPADMLGGVEATLEQESRVSTLLTNFDTQVEIEAPELE